MSGIAWALFIVGALLLIFFIIYGIRADRRVQRPGAAQMIEEAPENNNTKDQKIYLDIGAIAKIIANAGADSETVERCRERMASYVVFERVELKKYFDHVQKIIYKTQCVYYYQNLEWIERVGSFNSPFHETHRSESAIEKYNDACLIRSAIREYAEKHNLDGYQWTEWEEQVFKDNMDYVETH